MSNVRGLHSRTHPICGVEGCEKPVGNAKGLCSGHYMRLWRYGSATYGYNPPTLEGMKRCTVCAVVRPLDEFPTHKRNRDGRQAYCRPCHRIQVKAYKESHPEWAQASAFRQRQRLRKQVLDAYGNACACCGEMEPQFLSVDHIYNDGASHRREIGTLYRWLRQQGFPRDRFQLLCHNCNFAKGKYGECPHARAILPAAI